MIKRHLFKFGSVLMCAVMIVVYGVSAKGSTTGVEQVTAVQAAAGYDAEGVISEAISSQLTGISKAASATTNSKEELVYVFANASGKQDHIIVNENLKNVTGITQINDISRLKNIVNLSGDETSAEGANNTLTWEANGNSITYQGTSSESAPITMNVTYYLDGKEISPENLSGKSGRVTIRYDYVNHTKETVSIDGKEYTTAVPFTMITGMVLPSDRFSNIEVTNGRISELNDSSVVLGMTMPGLKDTLQLQFDQETLDIDIPDYFEVSADVKDFELDMSMSVATSNLLSDVNVDDLTIDSLKEKMTELQNAANQLTDGTVTLQDGTQKTADNIPALQEGTAALANGLSQMTNQVPDLTAGVLQLDEGAASLNSGSLQLNNGLNALSDSFKTKIVPGISQLEDGSVQLSSGITKLQQSLMSSFSQIKSNADVYTEKYQNYMTSAGAIQTFMTTGISEIGGGTLNALINEQMSESYISVTGISDWSITPYTDMGTQALLADSEYVSALYQKYMTEYTTIVNMKAGDAAGTYTAVFGMVNNVIASQDSLKAQGINAIEDLYNKEMQILLAAATNGNVSTALNQVYDTAMNTTDPETGETLSSSLEALQTGANRLKEGAAQLKAGIGSFEDLEPSTETACSALYKLRAGSSQLTTGTESLKNGTAQLSQGAGSLANGAAQLSDGANTLNQAVVTLGDGIAQLNSGAITLKDGMAEFNETGIKALTSLVGSDADTALNTLKAVVKAGQEYQSFAGKADDMEGSVTFIYKTEGVTNSK